MNLPKPKKGTKIAFKPVDDAMFIEFAVPNCHGGVNHHLFDVTGMWIDLMAEVNGMDKVLAGGAEVNEAENEPAYARMHTLALDFIEKKMPLSAEAALEGFLKATMEGPDEDVMEALRVYQSLWARLQELKAEKARQN